MSSFDEEKFVYWSQDPNFKPTIMNRRELASFLSISTQSIDNWVLYKGAPCRDRGGKGNNAQFCVQEFVEWMMAFRLGITVEEYRVQCIEEGLEARREFRLDRLEEENQRLREQLAELTGAKG